MKITKTLAMGAIMVLSFLSGGCVALNSGNVASGIQPLPYLPGEQSVVTTEKIRTNADGETTTDTTRVTKTGLAVNEGIQHGRLGVARDVGVARASNQSTSWWSTPPGYYNSGYGYGGGYYPHHYGVGGGHNTTFHTGGGGVYQPPFGGGGGGNTSFSTGGGGVYQPPFPGGGGVNTTFSTGGGGGPSPISSGGGGSNFTF